MGVLSVIGATPNPVREGTTSVTVQVRFTPDPVNAGLGLRDFTYRTVDGTATKGQDYIGFADSKVTFSTADTIPGLTTQEDFFFTIPIQDDAIVESPETFIFELASVQGALSGTDRVVITINDNDSPDQPAPLGRGTIRFEFANYVVIEGQPFIEARVIREGGQFGVIQGVVVVQFGTASEADISNLPNEASIFFGDQDITPKIIRIPIIDDNIPEPTEQFTLVLTERRTGTGQDVKGAENLLIDRSVVQIRDDDVSASVTIAPLNPNEGNTVTVIVTPIGVFEPGEVRTVTINTQDVTARLGEDFRLPNFSTLTFTFANSSSQTATILTVADQVSEQDETFQVVTTGTRAVNGVTLPLVITGGIQTVTISETPSIRITSVTPVVTEGLDRFAQVRVERTGDASRDISANLSTINGSAESGRDFVAISSQFARFAAGDSTPKIYNIPIIDNEFIQSVRTFTVELSNPQDTTPVPQIRNPQLDVDINVSGAGTTNIQLPPPFVPDPLFVRTPPSLSPPTTIIINDNDGPNAAAGTAAARGSIQFERASYVVDEGQAFLDIRIQRLGGTSGAVNAQVALGEADGSGVADNGTDFIATDQTSIFFADGVGGFQTIRIPIINDVTAEPTEIFALNLVERRGEQTLTVNSTIVQITDNDSNISEAELLGTAGFIGAAASGVINVNEGAGVVTIPIRFSGRTPRENLVRPSIQARTITGSGEANATPGADFIAIDLTQQFLETTVGETTLISIPIVNDRAIEITESFAVELLVNGAVLIGSNRLIVNIIDNDGVGDGNVPAVDSLASPFFSPITPTTQTAPFRTPEAVNPPAIPTDFSDTLLGTDAAEAIAGGAGNDTIDGRGGNDSLYGGADQDLLFGGPGRDFLFGNAGDDVLNAGDGDDFLFGGKGNDTLFGNEGNDFLSGDLGNDFLFGGIGNDRFALQANGGIDFVGDFTLGQDLLVLTEGLQFGQLSLNQVGANTVIRLTATSQDIMVLAGITAPSLTSASFVIG